MKCGWQQISSGLHILADLNSSVAWIVLILFLITNFFSRPLGTVPSTPNTIGITWLPPCYTAFSALWQDPDICLFFCFLLFFTQCFAGMTKSTQRVLFFLLINTSSGLVFWPGLGELFESQSSRELYVSFSWIDFGLCF